MDSIIKNWLNRESGFLVFESSTLAIGGLLIALLIGSIVLALTAYEYTRVENELVGNGVEANASLQRFR